MASVAECVVLASPAFLNDCKKDHLVQIPNDVPDKHCKPEGWAWGGGCTSILVKCLECMIKYQMFATVWPGENAWSHGQGRQTGLQSQIALAVPKQPEQHQAKRVNAPAYMTLSWKTKTNLLLYSFKYCMMFHYQWSKNKKIWWFLKED